ncbi:hypothetical protein P7C70_g1756, partial [Phenoliferia sp. Uapishka_3]
MLLATLLILLLAGVSAAIHAHSSPLQPSFSQPAAVVPAPLSATLACPSSPIMSQYFPTWTSQKPSQINWAYADIALFFVLSTAPTGFSWPDPSQALDFVNTAHKHKKKAVVTIGGWTGSGSFSNLLGTSQGIAGFAANIAALLTAYRFDGWLRSDGKKGAGNYRRFYDTCTDAPFLFSDKDKIFVSYDDSTSIGTKAAYARSMGLGGVAFYDSTGPDLSIFAAARSGLAGSFKRKYIFDEDDPRAAILSLGEFESESVQRST